MAIRQAFCEAAKLAFLNGEHASGDVYKMALYTQAASLGAETAAYTSIGEVTGIGYEPGGKQTQRHVGIDNGTAFLNFDDIEWHNASITAAGALLYNASATGQPAIAVLAFGREIGALNGTFRVLMPEPRANTALVRIV